MDSPYLKKRDLNDDEGINHSESQNSNKKCFQCNCERSMCLKMYCQCFSEGRYCSDCNCVNCQNFPGNLNLKKRVRLLNKGDSKFWHEAIAKESFDCQSHNSENTVKSCNCSRSKCLKGYCDCFNAGRFCNEFCKCCNCCNKVSSNASKSINTTSKKSNYFRWKNYVKNNQKENVDIKKPNINSRLDYIFLPQGSLYTHVFKNSLCNQIKSPQHESCNELMKKLIKTCDPKPTRVLGVSDTNKMISHYCNSKNTESPEKNDAVIVSKEFNSAGKMSNTDQMTSASTYNPSEKQPLINVRSLVAESQIRSH